MTIATSTWPPQILGIGRCFSAALRGEDLSVLSRPILARIDSAPPAAADLLDLSILLMLSNLAEDGLRVQGLALAMEQVYRVRPPGGDLRLLMFVGPGPLMANVPIYFLLEGSGISLDLVHLLPGQPLPADLPEHDLAVVGLGEADEARPMLKFLEAQLAGWPKPVFLDPGRIPLLARDRIHLELAGAPGVNMPATARIPLAEALRLARGEEALAAILPGSQWPILVRPVGSHAGKGLMKVDDAAALLAYLEADGAEMLYLTPFVNYASPDGLFRKYRITLIQGQPYAIHMAAGSHWMLHYLNAGMNEDAAKRANEAHWFATFDETFAPRHAAAFQAIHQRLGLDFVTLDCAETPEGDLLIFEADTAMIIHDLDPPELYPYKSPQMRKVFKAFQDMLRRLA